MRTLISIAVLFAAAVSLRNPCCAQSSAGPPADPDPAGDTRGRLAWFTDGQMRLAARASVAWRLTAAGAGNGPIGVAVEPAIGPMMPPLIPVVQHGFGHYAELRLTGTDVLIVGDSLTLRAGSDLHFLLQGAGGEEWAGAAAALAGWRSRAEVRWARPTAIGEFSFTGSVNRKGEQFSRGQVQARWLLRF